MASAVVSDNFETGSGGVPQLGGTSKTTCKAWVNFNGTGTVAIRDSYNVSSVTDLATGDYRVNFTTSFANTNYCPTTGFTADSLGNGDNRWPTIITSITTSRVDVACSIIANGWNLIDKTHLFVNIVGEQ